MKQERNYGIDLLRIVSMFMIVILHTLGHGRVIKSAVPMSAQYNAGWLLECAAFCAVNCFALVSGYVGLRSRFKLSGIAALWLQVVFYHAICTVLWAVTENRVVDWELIKSALQPVKNGAYWYYTAYLGISFIVPLVNAAVEQLDRRTLILCAAGLILLFSVYAAVERTDIFKLNTGYHSLWLLILYLLGACIRKIDPLPKWGKGVWAMVYVGAVLLTWGSLMLNNHLKAAHPGETLKLIDLIQYTSPTVLLSAIALVMLFSKLIPGSLSRKLIGLVSPLTFGVYLIHDSPFIRNTFMMGRMAEAAADAVPVMLAKVIAFAAAVFVSCLLIEYIRSKLFQWLHIRELLNKAEAALFRKKDSV